MLNAANIRAEYRQKKRARRDADDHADAPTTLANAKKRRRRADTEDTDAAGSKSIKAQQEATTIEIQPGESLKHFNRCAFFFFYLREENHFLKLKNPLFFQESRGPYASAGAIRNPCFGRN